MKSQSLHKSGQLLDHFGHLVFGWKIILGLNPFISQVNYWDLAELYRQGLRASQSLHKSGQLLAYARNDY